MCYNGTTITLTSSPKNSILRGYRARKVKMTEQKPEGLTIRIRLKAYDHRVIDQSARQIVETAIRTGPAAAPTGNDP